MDSYPDATPLWEVPYTSSLPQLPDDDFLTLLQKQFPNSNATFQDGFLDAVNPQNVSRYSFPSITPPSEDSSPSPPNNNDLSDGGDFALKRKASGQDVEGGPSQKSQHTLPSKKSTGNRKKSTGGSGVPKDETRLLKRKEQNRAAQRAFRERKEKHVKDLEDKVAELEAMNEQANHENENLRDLLNRLQTENMALKQFTFTVPKSGSPTGQASTSFASQSSDFTSSPRSPTSPSVKSPDSIKSNNPLDWNSLTSFDPAMLNLLDEGRQSTATDGARQMDFSFGPSAGLTPNASFTTIASNPLFMSYASAFDSASPIQDTNDQNNGFFDLNGLTWSPPPQQQDTSSLDDLFAGYMTRGLDYSFMPGPSSLTSESPVNHHANVSNVTHSPASSSPSSSNSDPLFETRDGSASESDTGHFPEVSNIHSGCPRTKGELARKIESSGMSPFAPPLGPNNVRKSDSAHGPMITCTGTTTTLPKTQKSDDNIEVLSAWRSITSNPKFKDVDIDRLCSEFTSKAKCDGTKVVLEPQGVDSILQSLALSKA